jgi:predicted nuclease of predicted toxin-antitoxin system
VILWIDAQISPRLCSWLRRQFRVEVAHVRDLDLREAEDREIFERARNATVVVLTKDEDFVDLVRRFGPPPQVLWLRCGNTSNARLKSILVKTLPDALELVRQGEVIVEISRAAGDEEKRTERSTRPRMLRRSSRRAKPRSGGAG